MMLDYFLPFLVGFLGSLHCMGMCGPLVLAYTLHMKPANAPLSPRCSRAPSLGLVQHLLFNAGRMATYGIMGTIAAILFLLVDLHRYVFTFRIHMNMVAGVLLLLMGLMLLRVIPLPSWLTTVSASSSMGRRIHRLFQSQKTLHKFFLGMAVGTLPCCLSWAMVIKAASTQNPAQGFLTMVVFGLGTVPALVLVGVSSSFMSQRVRFLGERMAALAIMATGLMILLKGAGVLG